MRLKIKLTPTDKLLPINNQHIVNGFIHKLLGKNNNYHDNYSDYVVGSLRGGKYIGDNKISFKNGGYIMVSAYDQDFLVGILTGILKHDQFHLDIMVNGFEYLPNEVFYDGWNHFKTLTPILLKNNGIFKTLSDNDFIVNLINQTKRKLKKINPKLNIGDLDIRIRKHPNHKIKKILIKNVINKASQCQLSIQCNKEVADLIYHIGIGNSTGSGFGMLYKTESNHLY